MLNYEKTSLIHTQRTSIDYLNCYSNENLTIYIQLKVMNKLFETIVEDYFINIISIYDRCLKKEFYWLGKNVLNIDESS